MFVLGRSALAVCNYLLYCFLSPPLVPSSHQETTEVSCTLFLPIPEAGPLVKNTNTGSHQDSWHGFFSAGCC